MAQISLEQKGVMEEGDYQDEALDLNTNAFKNEVLTDDYCQPTKAGLIKAGLIKAESVAESDSKESENNDFDVSKKKLTKQSYKEVKYVPLYQINESKIITLKKNPLSPTVIDKQDCVQDDVFLQTNEKISLDAKSIVEKTKEADRTYSLKGSFGEVLKIWVLNQPIIVKKVKEVKWNEIFVPSLICKAENTAKVLGVFFDLDCKYIFQEDAGSSLKECIKNSDFRDFIRCSEKNFLNIALDIANGLDALHSRNFCHCDIKPENICAKFYPDNSWKAKLIDFGSSKCAQEDSGISGITPQYLPPSANKILLLDPKKLCLDCTDDVWASGMVIRFLGTDSHPTIMYCDKNKQSNWREVARVIEKFNDPLPDFFLPKTPVVTATLLQNVLVVDRKKRWTAKEMCDFLNAKIYNLHLTSQTELNSSQIESSMEDVDIKKCKGKRGPYIPWTQEPAPAIEEFFLPNYGKRQRDNMAKADLQKPGNVTSLVAGSSFARQTGQLIADTRLCCEGEPLRSRSPLRLKPSRETNKVDSVWGTVPNEVEPTRDRVLNKVEPSRGKVLNKVEPTRGRVPHEVEPVWSKLPNKTGWVRRRTSQVLESNQGNSMSNEEQDSWRLQVKELPFVGGLTIKKFEPSQPQVHLSTSVEQDTDYIIHSTPECENIPDFEELL